MAPTGGHLIYRVFDGSSGLDSRFDVYRATSAGKGKVNLTAELDTRSSGDGWTSPVGWR